MYSDQFFSSRHQATYLAAKSILPIVQSYLPTIKSAVDVGCGVGTWLYEAQQIMQLENYLGIDGEWVDLQHLVISKDSFQRLDLEKPIKIAQRFDLAISLEVAEHLSPASADTFVQSLVSLSKVILFSAAIPHQGGTNHLNEQWPDYWAAKFAQHNYRMLDVIRDQIWDKQDVLVQYRQNCFLVVADSFTQNLELSSPSIERPLARVHPDLYTTRMTSKATSIKRSAANLVHAIINSAKHRLRK